MAMKKSAADHSHSAKDDMIIYKVMIALGILCIAVLTLNLVGRFYGRADGAIVLHTVFFWSALVLAAAALASLVLGFAFRKRCPTFRHVYFPLFIVLALFAVSAALLRLYWVSPLPYLYFMFIAAAVLYIIFLLYQMEFFLLSIANVCAGVVFYLLSHTDAAAGVSARMLLLDIALVLVLAVISFLAFACRTDGKLKLGQKHVRLFLPRFSPLPMYLTAAIWLICLIAAFFLGSVFAYYCVFAVAAWELVCAVYYTFKLS